MLDYPLPASTTKPCVCEIHSFHLTIGLSNGGATSSVTQSNTSHVDLGLFLIVRVGGFPVPFFPINLDQLDRVERRGLVKMDGYILGKSTDLESNHLTGQIMPVMDSNSLLLEVVYNTNSNIMKLSADRRYPRDCQPRLSQ